MIVRSFGFTMILGVVFIVNAHAGTWPVGITGRYTGALNECKRNHGSAPKSPADHYTRFVSESLCAYSKIQVIFQEPKTTICPGVGLNTFRDCFNDVLDHFSRNDKLTSEGLTLLATLPSLYYSSQPKRRDVEIAIALAETTLDALDYFDRREKPKPWLEKNLRVETNDSKEIDQLDASDQLTTILSANSILKSTNKMIGLIRKTMKKYPHYAKHSDRVAELKKKYDRYRKSFPKISSNKVRILKQQIELE